MKSTWVRVVLSAASLALTVVLLLFLPRFVDTTWSAIGAQFGRLGPVDIVLLVVFWLASLLAYTFVMTAGLPGLTHAQALTLNGAGSAVSNVLPFGGGVGVALTFTMARGWGHPMRSIVAYTLVTGVWNTLFRFILPAVGIVCLVAAGQTPNGTVTSAAVAGAVSILVLVAVVASALFWPGAARLLGRVLDRLARLLPRRIRPGEHAASEALDRLRQNTADIIRTRWLQLSLGMTAFLGFQALLLVVCLHATGSYPGIAQTVAAFALSRVLTTALVTPSGAGIMEAGTAGFLVSMGVAQDSAVFAALIFGFFTYTIEIPFGALCLGAWAFLRRRNPQPPAQDDETPHAHPASRP
ncbi:lysylphosphatidylglycerol synthase transmembrane domain-containing protein [Bailinhaonella thermotolerans]|uniref:UPF0104 family protein n=1 Tax=Bailinhaonella thermotolerans TaxID=1070861 RepID=A0A3A4AS22_9ACTN|nr:lysylphosphatidylglycerol synthase transmembrane domain-containing protein [Bailinhaonella thermotolerans]RJL32678.1 UPF0104 family protein [Bailinhaonella thermotolerans]